MAIQVRLFRFCRPRIERVLHDDDGPTQDELLLPVFQCVCLYDRFNGPPLQVVFLGHTLIGDLPASMEIHLFLFRHSCLVAQCGRRLNFVYLDNSGSKPPHHVLILHDKPTESRSGSMNVLLSDQSVQFSVDPSISSTHRSRRPVQVIDLRQDK
jgi:hypothetical protein